MSKCLGESFPLHNFALQDIRVIHVEIIYLSNEIVMNKHVPLIRSG